MTTYHIPARTLVWRYDMAFYRWTWVWTTKPVTYHDEDEFAEHFDGGSIEWSATSDLAPLRDAVTEYIKLIIKSTLAKQEEHVLFFQLPHAASPYYLLAVAHYKLTETEP